MKNLKQYRKKELCNKCGKEIYENECHRVIDPKGPIKKLILCSSCFKKLKLEEQKLELDKLSKSEDK